MITTSYSSLSGEAMAARLRNSPTTQHGAGAAAAAVRLQNGKTKSLDQAAEELQSTAAMKGKNLHGQMDKAAYNKKLKEACDGFEELFVHKMIQVMRESGTTSEHLLHGGRGEEIFQDMLDETYAKQFSQTGQLGLGKVIYDATKEV